LSAKIEDGADKNSFVFLVLKICQKLITPFFLQRSIEGPCSTAIIFNETMAKDVRKEY
jgi:hypothetical protein